MAQPKSEKSEWRELIGQTQTRNFALSLAATTRAADDDGAGESADADNREVSLAFASDAPIEHWWGRVILDMSPSSVRLDRLTNHGPLMWNHSWYTDDPENFLGRLFNISLGEGLARATARFSRGAKAEKVLRDVRDGLLDSVSVGFIIHSLKLEESTDEMDTYRALDWEPIEVSMVAVPADTSVGVGRNLNSNNNKPVLPAKRKQMDNESPAPAPVSVTAQDAELRAIGQHYNETELADDYSLQGRSVTELRQAILAKRQAAGQNKPAARLTPADIGLSETERRRYSITRALRSTLSTKPEACLETEVSAALAKLTGRAVSENGILVPTGVGIYQRAGLDTATDTKGQELVFTEAGSFIDLLRNVAMVMMLGATVMPGLQGNIAMPKQIGAGTAIWTTENPGSDVADSNLTLDQVLLSPKTLMSSTSYSRQLMNQSVVDIDNLVMRDLVTITALAIDRAALHGTGSSGEPKGLYNISGLNAVAFGGGISFAKTVEMESAIRAANAALGSMAYLTTPEIRGKAKQTQQFSGTNGMALWTGEEMNGYKAGATNQIAKTMNGSAATGGTSHGILFGVWSELLIGEWGTLELITDPYRLKKQGMIEVTSFVQVDIQARYPEAFTKGTGLTNT